MKKTILIAMIFMAAVAVNAQVKTPAPSPEAKVEQVVGLTDVTLTYSRPSMKGRTIFGDLVPYDKLWRTGANANTVITFSDDVEVAENKLEAGSYAIFTKPGQANWEVFFYKDTNNWGTPRQWEETKIAASFTVEAQTLASDVETFTIAINHLSNAGAHLEISWEKTKVAIPFTVPTNKKAIASIEATMAGPSANDYYGAAVFYLQEKKDLNKAKEWIDMAIAKRPEAFWMYRQKSLIHAELGDKKGAIAAAKQSLELAKKANNADYVKLNEDSLKEWGAK
jgi:tetratricopeptide (TPR) repeat protein